MKTLTKKIQRSEDLFIQFTSEELKDFNIKEGDKFSWEISDEGVCLKKFATIDLDLSEFSKDVLELLITESIQKDISVNDVITNILEDQLLSTEDSNDSLV